MATIVHVTKNSYMHRAYMLIVEIPSTTEEIAAELDMKMKNAAALLDDLESRGMTQRRGYGNCGMRVWVPVDGVDVVPVDRSYWAEQQRQRVARQDAAKRLPVQLCMFA